MTARSNNKSSGDGPVDAGQGRGASDKTKEKILAAATDEFVQHGLNGARVDRIAANAGANKSLIYTYFGNKEELYTHVLEETYRHIRKGEHELNLDQRQPEEAMRVLVCFTHDHFCANPEFIRMLNAENMQKAKYLKSIERISEMHSPMIAAIEQILDRGKTDNIFHADADPVQLYVSIAALSYFPLSNVHTLSINFSSEIGSDDWLAARRQHVEDMVMTFLMASDRH